MHRTLLLPLPALFSPCECVAFARAALHVPDTEWVYWDGSRLVGDFSRPAVGIELYPHHGDNEANFDLFENVNVAVDPANAEILEQMHALVLKQWRL